MCICIICHVIIFNIYQLSFQHNLNELKNDEINYEGLRMWEPH